MEDTKKCPACDTELVDDVCPVCSADGDMDDDMSSDEDESYE